MCKLSEIFQAATVASAAPMKKDCIRDGFGRNPKTLFGLDGASGIFITMVYKESALSV